MLLAYQVGARLLYDSVSEVLQALLFSSADVCLVPTATPALRYRLSDSMALSDSHTCSSVF